MVNDAKILTHSCLEFLTRITIINKYLLIDFLKFLKKDFGCPDV